MISLAALTAASFAAVGFSANVPLIRQTFGLSHVAVGAIASSVYGAAAATSVVAGRVTDRTRPAPVLVVALALLGVGVAVAALAPTPAGFFAGVAICGLGYGAVNPPTNVLANPAAGRRRGLAMSVKQSGIPLGGIAAGALLPILAGAAGWRWAMVVPVLVCAALVLPSAAVRTAAARDSVANDERDVARVALRLSRGSVFGFLMAGVQVTIFTFLAVYLTDDRRFTVGAAGRLLALLMLGGLLGRLIWGAISDRWHHDRIRALQVVSVLGGVGLAFLPVLHGVALAMLVLAVGLCSVGWNGVYLTVVSESVAPSGVGAATGTALLGVNVGAVCLPPLYGLVVGSQGWAAGWYLCASLSLVAVAVLQVSRSRSSPAQTGEVR